MSRKKKQRIRTGPRILAANKIARQRMTTEALKAFYELSAKPMAVAQMQESGVESNPDRARVPGARETEKTG